MKEEKGFCYPQCEKMEEGKLQRRNKIKWGTGIVRINKPCELRSGQGGGEAEAKNEHITVNRGYNVSS